MKDSGNNSDSNSIEVLLDLADQGDERAVHQLLHMHRDRLRKFIALRMEPRLARRIDPSDVIQDSLIDAARRLPEYVAERAIAFYPWLRQIAKERLIDARRRHSAQKRDVNREQELPLTDQSISQLATQFQANAETPEDELVRQERQLAVHQALLDLREEDRELLVMRYLEQMSNAEVADALSLTVPAVKTRHTRILDKLHRSLKDLK